MSKDVVRPVSEFGRDEGVVHEMIVTGRKVGAGEEFYSRLAHDEKLFAKVVAFVNRGGYEATLSQRRAREIMGGNFIGIEEVIQNLGEIFTPEQISVLKEVFFSEPVLEARRKTHVLIPGFSLSLDEIQGQFPTKVNYDPPFRAALYKKRGFVQEKVAMKWYLVRKNVIPDSFKGHLLGDKAASLKIYNEKILRPCEIVWALALYRLVKGEYFLPDCEVICDALGEYNSSVHVEVHSLKGIYVSDGWTFNADRGVGAASHYESQLVF